MESQNQPYILMVGNDSSIAYLLERYAQQSGHGTRQLRHIDDGIAPEEMGPQAIFCLSLEALEAFQSCRASFADIPVVVCSSVADDVRANELGADYLFLHPITYDYFLSVLEGGKKQFR